MKRHSLAKNSSLICLLLILTFQLFAQTKENTLILTVQDPLNNIVAEAQIVLTDSAKKERQTKTNKLGIAQFNNLPAGEYKVKIIQEGFIDYVNEKVVVKEGEQTKLDILLELAPVEAKVEVDGSESVHPDDYGMVTVLTKEDIAKLPDDPQEFLRALRRIAGESITGDDLPIRVNDLEGQEIPPKEQIEQIRIDRNAFSAKYPGTGGGGVQIYSSSSVKSYKGFFGFGFADSRLNSANPFLGSRLPFQSRNYRGGLSGPLGSKTSFSLSLSRNVVDSSAYVNAIILDSNLRQTELKTTFATPSLSHNFNLSINSSPAKKHKIYLAYNFSTSKSNSLGGLFTLPERASISSQNSQSISFTHTYLKNDNFVNKLYFAARFSNNRFSSEGKGPAIDVAEAFYGGGSPSNSSFGSSSFTFGDDAEDKRGKFSLQYGFEVSRTGNSQESRSNFNGTYSFNGRIAPLLDDNNNPQIDSSGNIITGQITSLESYRRTLLFRRLGYSALRIRELGGGADQFSIAGGNPSLSAHQFEYEAYFQAGYNLRKNLGLNFGLRYENQTNIHSPLDFAPKFSMIWSPRKKEKGNIWLAMPRVSIGTGLSYQRFGLSNTLSLRQINDAGRSAYFISTASAFDPALSAAILAAFPNVPSINSLEQLSFPRTRRFFDKDLRTPYTLSSNITLNKPLPNKFGISFSVSHSRSFRRQVSRNINAPLAGTFNQLNPLAAVYPIDNGGNIYRISSIGESESIRFSSNLIFPEMKWRKKPLFLSLRYGYGKSRDNVVTGSGSSFDAYDFSREYAPSSSDGVHTINASFNQELPFKIGIGGELAIRSGSRYNITTGRDANGDGIYNERPSFAANQNKPGVVNTKYGLLDPNPQPGDVIIPRNLGRGPGSIDFDMRIIKMFPFHMDQKTKRPKQALSIAVSISNVLNIKNKGNPIGNMSSPNFARIVNGGGAFFGAGDDFFFVSSGSISRSMNFSVNFNF